jgi:thiamine biosynthesis lipoprotein
MSSRKLIRTNRAAWLTASAVMAAAAVPAAAEVYLTEAQALGVIFGEHVIPRREQKVLDPELRARLEHASNLHFPEASYAFFISGQAGQPQRYGVVMSEIGKTEPITFMVGMNDQGKVSEVVIMEFRENRGWEVKEKRFLNQFRGKTARNSIRVDEDIINYTGATLSSKAVARGVKRALLLLDAFYPIERRRDAAAATDFAMPAAISPVLRVLTQEEGIGLYRQMRYAMGSACEISVWCRSSEDAQRALRGGFTEIERIEEKFSAYRESSELALVNREAGRKTVPVSDEFLWLTEYAIQSWYSTRGMADITVGPLMKLWGFREDKPRVPRNAEISATRKLVGCDKLQLDRRAGTLRFRRDGMALDFGGLAKGYAAQAVVRELPDKGAVAALVNLGRSSLAAARNTLQPGTEYGFEQAGLAIGEWLVGVVNPVRDLACPAHVVLQPGQCLSTSGTYEREFEIDGRTFSHIIDPRTGWPLEGPRSVTAISASGPRSEVLAKQELIENS